LQFCKILIFGVLMKNFQGTQYPIMVDTTFGFSKYIDLIL
jgi:hypothetical protein